MAEISASDLRRLEALEGKLAKAQDDRKTLAEEKRELRAAVAAGARQRRALDQEIANTTGQLEAVLAENAALAQRLEDVTSDLERIRSASLELRKEVDAARADLKNAQSSLTRAQRELSVAQADRTNLAKTLALANEQLAGKSITPVLPATDVAKLVDGLVSDLGRGLPGLAIRDGEVRLKVAFGTIGETTGFVIPSAKSPPEMRENLHEVAVRFDRALLPPAES
jgi:multidrug resistance efflux pump